MRGARDRPPVGRAVPALLLLTLASGPLAGQVERVVVVPEPLSVVARRDLQFGDVFRGRPSSVTPRDHRAALFEVEFGAEADLLLTFLLPPALLSSGGQALPLRFGPGDGVLVREGPHRRAGAAGFDPTRPLSAFIGVGERVLLHLGGTASPTVAQALTTYRGTITLVVAALGT